MSKLRENPAKEVPKRVLILAPIVMMLIFGATFILNFNLFLVLGFFILGLICNLACFWLIVKGSALIVKKQEAGEKASIMPNTILRYTIYAIFLIIAAQFGTQAFIGSMIGVLMVKIAIATDGVFF